MNSQRLRELPEAHEQYWLSKPCGQRGDALAAGVAPKQEVPYFTEFYVNS